MPNKYTIALAFSTQTHSFVRFSNWGFVPNSGCKLIKSQKPLARRARDERNGGKWLGTAKRFAAFFYFPSQAISKQ